MATTQPYVVIRLVPDSPVDGATFATYLDGLQLQLIDAYTGAPLSDYAYSSPLVFSESPPGSGIYGAVVSVLTSVSTAFAGSGNYGNTLTLEATGGGISVGSFIFTTDPNVTIPTLTVVDVTGDVTGQTVTLSGTLTNYVPAGTVVSFAPPTATIGAIVTGSTASAPSFTVNTNDPATDLNGKAPSSGDPATVLPIPSTSGVLVGMGVSGTGISPGTTVAAVNDPPSTSGIPAPSITLSIGATSAPPVGTTITLTWLPPFVSLTLTPTSSTSSSTSSTLTFSSGSKAQGVAFGMTVSSATSGLIKPGTTVTDATTTTVTFSPPLQGTLTAGDAVTFTFPLSSGIVQDNTIDVSFHFAGVSFVIVPMAVATAIIPLNSTSPPPYLDVKIRAIRGSQTLPQDNTYYNIYYSQDDLPSPDQYQWIPPNETGLYISLPPPPLKSFISLTIPSDGSPPQFDPLYTAIQTALQNDPSVVQTITPPAPALTASTTATCPAGTTTLTFGGSGGTGGIVAGMFVSGTNILPGTFVQAGSVTATTITISNPALGSGVGSGSLITFTTVPALIGTLITSPANCTRVAYDIVWSYQNNLPLPPDPLDSLYTNGPNTGGSTGDSTDSTNPLEQDRIKFEGTLNSFYSTRNANAERLTKFVAAASAAVYCEKTTLNSTSALLEFPVDPSSPFAFAVESELLVQGVGLGGTSGLVFGVPAAFFYALGASQDKSASALQRYQTATGDEIKRLLQQFSVAENAGVINDSEAFVSTAPGLPTPVTSFQAARRLVALGASAASTTPTVTAYSGTPLASLIADWLGTKDPTPVPTPNPSPTYESMDFAIWSQKLDASDPQGYLYLDLDALTQGYVIPSFTAPVSAASGSTLTFAGTGLGIAPGMPVGGTNIAGGTTVSASPAPTTTTTVTLSPPGLSGGGVTTTETITFSSGNSAVTASPTVNILAGVTLTLVGSSATSGIKAGTSVSGTGVAAGTTVVASVTTTNVTLSTPVLGSIPTNEAITFNAAVPSVQTTTTVDCPSGNTLTFSGTVGIGVGFTVFGTNIQPGTTVTAVSPTTVTLAVGKSVTGDVPPGSVITFATLAGTLADQIFAWLPSTTTTAPPPTIATLKAVTATQWTNFFAFVGNPTWLPPFTRPVAPGTSTKVTDPSTNGYVALRIRAFIRAVQQFFTVSTVSTSAQLPAPGAPPIFDLPPFDPIALAVQNLPSVQLATTVDCPSGNTLTFGSTAGISKGMAVFGPNIPPSTTVKLKAVATPTVTLSNNVTGDVPLGSVIAFGFGFSGTLNGSDLATAVQAVFPNDPAARKWLSQAMTAISQLYQVASVVTDPTVLPNPVSLEFSVVEALYARGFRSASDITKLSAAEFQQALTGTVAYDFANAGTISLYQEAQSLAPTSTSPGQGVGSFSPINPHGSLVNCIPPPCLSPTSPIAYLQEMLKLSPASTCDDPWAVPASGQTVLGDAVLARRGPLGNLLASCANLETPLPLIDIVNECLEYLASTQPPAGNSTSAAPSGAVYNTSADELAAFTLCKTRDCKDDIQPGCHDPAAIFAALPEYSTPATPIAANQLVEPAAFNLLKSDFSSCLLPYSQALDVSRTYLRHLGSCRFEELRSFRKCITEFALDPANPPTGFQPHLWRYPVRIETAIEYLGITPEEYTSLFFGTAPQPCASVSPNPNQSATPISATATRLIAAQLLGPSSSAREDTDLIDLSDFLHIVCLTYCEFLEFAKLGLIRVIYGNNREGQALTLPDCEPCCLKNYHILPPGGDRNVGWALVILVFIRLWKKLREVCGARYTFQQLYDICSVLQLTNSSGLNPEFIRQLAAFQMLRDHFELPLLDPSDQTTGAVGAARTHLLALWVGSSAKKWNWAVHRLLDGVEGHARLRYGCKRPRGEFVAHMADNLDALSRLAGFNPPTATNPSTDTWNSSPGCTLRFAEVLAKIGASSFRIGELLYLFNATPPQDSEDPFPPQDPEEALNYPLGLPEDEPEHSLWRLREALLAVEVREVEAREWTWSRISAELRDKFGYAPPSGQDALLSIGQHFFPDVLSASGFSVSVKQRQYRSRLTSGTAWSSPSGSPFQYDSSSTELWIQLPLRDEAVAASLSQLPQLNPAEQAAVQDLYFAPRADMALLSFLFPDWQAAEIALIQERDEERRWAYFRRHFALANARRKVVAEHLARHVERRTGCRSEGLRAVAGLVLSHLLADENSGTPWESDSGVPPAVMWTPLPTGGAIAALLGLIGTGLLGEYEPVQSQNNQGPVPAGDGASSKQILWREVRGPLEAFGHERDLTNSPVPTVLPALDLSVAANPLLVFQNGYADKSSDGFRLGGAEAFLVRWSGALLIEFDGEYAFHAGAPTPEGERPDFEKAQKSHWRVTLTRGQKTWTILNHQWPGDTNPERNMTRMRRGAYHIVVEYSQSSPDFAGPHLHARRTGFQLKYVGPDSSGCLVSLPLNRLYREHKDHTLNQGIQFLPGSKNAEAFLKAFYTSTLRDIRRTYQGAFKAVLFAGKLGLSAEPNDDGQSELGYLLSNPALFAGHAYYRTTTTSFATHLANFDLDFLPLQDNYHAPTPVPPDRSTPSLQRTQAMFDWWERLFDYGSVREEAHLLHKGPLWRLFDEAQRKNPADPGQLLMHIGADPRCWPLDLRFYQDQSAPIYSVSSADLQDDRWLIRAWQANRWIRGLLKRFHPKDIATARPDLWASQDPSEPIPASGVPQTGNANLAAFLDDGYLQNGEPRRYLDVKRLNDGLRDRGRRGLVAYLCSSNRVQLTWMSTIAYATQPRDLSDLLLLDVETGLCERSSRIEEAITAVQSFVQRTRLGLEPGWKVGREFAQLWESRFETYHRWERCKRREIYKENWIEWSELSKARRIEAFRLLESKLHTSTLTLAAPGGMDWWADDDSSLERAPELLQRRVPSTLHPLTSPPQSATREGLATLGTPEYADETTWLTPVPQASATTNSPPTNSSSPTPPTSNPPAPIARVPQAVAGTSNTRSLIFDPTSGGQSQPRQLPFWMESAIKLGTRFLRVAAAGLPPAGLKFVPHGDEPHSACCHECGHEHPMLVDEYYFWLVDSQFYAYTDDTDAQSGDASFTGSYQFGFKDSYYDQYQQQSAEWDDEDQVPQLLAKWQPNPGVRLAWCRVHHDQFQQPRKSEGYVPISAPADLIFLGRAGDSVYFQVSGGTTPPPPGYTDNSPPGFRFDLPSDRAIALPQVTQAPAPVSPSPYPGGLLSYPFFAYEDPGARLFPESWFSPALLVAEALRAHCRFDLALKWYQRAFDPLQRDCTWMICPDAVNAAPPTHDQIADEAYHIWEQHGHSRGEENQDWLEAERELTPHSAAIGGPADHQNEGGACCDSANVTDEQARHRTLTLDFCQTLFEWGDALMSRRRAPEAFRQARLLFDTAARITGPRPRTILMPEPTSPTTVAKFAPAFAPLNPRLLDLYDTVADRLGLIHHCLDGRRINEGQLRRDVSYFGDDPWREGWRPVSDPCDDETDWCCRPSPYRFTFQIEKALALAGNVRELGASLLAAYEKGDAEILASIHANQERELLALGLSIRQDQWHAADWQVQALQQTKDVNQTNLIYYTNLYQNGLINDEIQNLTLATNAMQTRTSANIMAAVGESMTIVPDFFVGAMSTFSQIPIGTKLAGLFGAISKIMETVADIQSATASIDMTEAGWDRRSFEWFHQMQTLPIEIQQVELQILAAHRNRDQALQELNNQQRGIENAAEVQDFLRDKFTATELYLHLHKHTAALHASMHRLARCAALEAQRAYNFERGHTTRRFVPKDTWDSLHDGLMAGDRLESALHHMQKAYLDENVREYELTKHFSLRLHFPLEFMRLKATGRCEIDIPEWMYDLDWPGQYMRRIRNVSLTIPVVAGRYTGVNCRATLLSSQTRIDPRLEAPPTHCCCDSGTVNGYEACPHDRRIVRSYGARDAIATSSGQNDSGLFELNFHDERYLPFEFDGAIGRWQFELPAENNFYPMETLTDLCMLVNYTSREGGDPLRRAASEVAQKHLPGDGWCFFDVRHEFADAWQLLRNSRSEKGAASGLNLRLERRMFPFIPGACDLSIKRIALLFSARELNYEDRRQIAQCPCPPEDKPGSRMIEVLHGSAGEPLRVACEASEEWPELCCGVFETKIGPLGRPGEFRPEVGFRFPAEIGELENVYLLCQYQRELRPS